VIDVATFVPSLENEWHGSGPIRRAASAKGEKGREKLRRRNNSAALIMRLEKKKKEEVFRLVDCAAAKKGLFNFGRKEKERQPEKNLLMADADSYSWRKKKGDRQRLAPVAST